MYIDLKESNTFNFTRLVYHAYASIQPSKTAKKSGDLDRQRVSVNKKLKLINGRDHEEIWACTWQLEDTECALRNFEKFGLLGPTKYGDTDECYLRLYGFLACIFMQKDAVLELVRMLMPHRQKEVAHRFKENILVQLRNRLGSHNVSNLSGKRTSILDQRSLQREELFIHYVTDKSHDVHLPTELHRFKILLDNELERIAEYMISTLCDQDKEVTSRLAEALDAIKRRRRGDLVTEHLDGSYIYYTSDPRSLEEE